MKNLKDQIIPFMKTRLEKRSLQWRPGQLCSPLARLLPWEQHFFYGYLQLPFAPSSPVKVGFPPVPFVPATCVGWHPVGLSVLVPLPSLFLTAETLTFQVHWESILVPPHLGNLISLFPSPEWLCPPTRLPTWHVSSLDIFLQPEHLHFYSLFLSPPNPALLPTFSLKLNHSFLFLKYWDRFASLKKVFNIYLFICCAGS